MNYASDGFMFRKLNAEEVAEFQKYARENDPPAGKGWSIYHPVCRAVWIERGFSDPGGLFCTDSDANREVK